MRAGTTTIAVAGRAPASRTAFPAPVAWAGMALIVGGIGVYVIGDRDP